MACCGLVQKSKKVRNRGRQWSCCDEHIFRMDDPVVGCFARDSEHVVLPPDYRLYKNAPRLPPLDGNAMTPNTAENNTTQVAVGRSLEDIIGRSSSGSDCGGTLLVVAAAITKKRSASSNLLPPVKRTVSTRSQAAGDMKRRLFPI